jgi:iron complex outermembrane receptor protein
MHLDVVNGANSHDSTAEAVEGDTPKHQLQLSSFYRLGYGFDWDTSVYFIGALEGGHFPSYTRLDTRLGWKIGESVELSVGGQNLLTPRHLEFPDAFEVNHTFVERSVFGRVTWRF